MQIEFEFTNILIKILNIRLKNWNFSFTAQSQFLSLPYLCKMEKKQIYCFGCINLTAVCSTTLSFILYSAQQGASNPFTCHIACNESFRRVFLQLNIQLGRGGFIHRKMLCAKIRGQAFCMFWFLIPATPASCHNVELWPQRGLLWNKQPSSWPDEYLWVMHFLL